MERFKERGRRVMGVILDVESGTSVYTQVGKWTHRRKNGLGRRGVERSGGGTAARKAWPFRAVASSPSFQYKGKDKIIRKTREGAGW